MISNNSEAVQICEGSLVDVQPLITSDSRFLLCAKGCKVNVYSCENGERCRVFKGHDSNVVCIYQLSEDSTLVISGSCDGKIILWSFENGSIEKSFKLATPLNYFCPSLDEEDVSQCFYGVIKNKKNNSIIRFSIPNNKVKNLNTEILLKDVEYSPRCSGFGMQNTVYAHTSSKKLHVHDLKTKKSYKHICSQKITCIACNPNEKMIATGMMNGMIIIWKDFCGPYPITSHYHWHSLPLKTLEFTPDGVTLYSGGYECVLVVWTLLNMKKSFLPRLGSPICRVSSNADSSLIAVCNIHNGIQLIDTGLSVTKVVQGFTQICKDIPLTGTRSIHGDQKTGLVFFVGLPGQLQFYDVAKDSHAFHLDVTKQNYTPPENLSNPIPCTEITHVCLSEDGMWLVTAQSLKYPMGLRVETSLKFWYRSAGSFEFHSKYEIEDISITCIASRNFSKSGFVPTFATTLTDGSFCTWECVPTGETGKGECSWRQGFSREYRSPRSCAFSCDGSVLGVVHDRCISIWDALKEKRQRVLCLFKDDEIHKTIVFGQKYESNIFYVATERSLACWSPKREEQWIAPFNADVVVGNPGTEELVAFTRDSKIEVYIPQSSIPVKSIILSITSPVVSACLRGSSLIFINENQELFVMKDAAVEMECDEATGKVPEHINMLSHLTTSGKGRTFKKSSLEFTTNKQKVLEFSNMWGIKYLEMITPQWQKPMEINVDIPSDMEDE